MVEYLMCKFDDSILNNSSILIDIGGFEGEFIDYFNKKYGCYIYSFEPVKRLYNNLKKMETDKIKVINNAVWSHDNKEKTIYDYGISSSLFKQSGKNFHNRKLKSENIVSTIGINTIFKMVYKELGSLSKKIDLLKINTEGSEIEIINAISKENIKNCNQICIQFHEFLQKRFDNHNLLSRKNINECVNKITSCGFKCEEWGKGPNYYFWK